MAMMGGGKGGNDGRREGCEWWEEGRVGMMEGGKGGNDGGGKGGNDWRREGWE